MVGKTLSHYEILAPLGAGGMGEVYRARDTKLERDVAVKVLPDDLAADPDRLARFEREAKLLAALNHTNIGAIYGLDAADGIHFLVLELIEGETLEQRLRKGAIPVPEALEIACQIAEALEAAHDVGIIHRDVKPANVLLTAKGGVKVLDFGIAKSTLLDSAANVKLTEQATSLTVDGTLMGTPPYMAPEQIRGEEIDKRADIWAFGCVVYEMLTGRGAFVRETVADTLVAVLEAEPGWPTLPSALPDEVAAVLRRCLRKDPERRLHDMGDARIEIEDALSPSREESRASHGSRAPGRQTLPWALVAVLVMAFGVVLWNVRDRLSPGLQATSVERYDITLPEGVLYGNNTDQLAISPDGARVVFGGSSTGRPSSLFLWEQSAREPVAIEGTEGAGARHPTFSADGDWVAFLSGNELKKVAVNVPGSQPQHVADLPLAIEHQGLAWTASGEFILGQATAAGDLWILRQEGGEFEPLAPGNWFGLSWLPGSRMVLGSIVDASTWSADEATIAAVSLEGGEVTELLPGGFSPKFVEPGYLVFASKGSLRAAAFDRESLRVLGPSALVEPDLRVNQAGGGAAAFAVSRTGTLVYARGGERPAQELFLVARDGTVLDKVVDDADPFFQVRAAPDGRWLAVTKGWHAHQLWLVDVERGSQELLIREDSHAPRFTRGGEFLYMNIAPDLRLARLPRPFAAMEPELLTSSRLTGEPHTVSPDGRTLLYMSNASGNRDIFSLRPDDGGEEEEFLVTEYNEGWPEFHPNGDLIAYQSDRSGPGQYEVYVALYPGGAPVRVSTDGGERPRWAPNGRELFFQSGRALWAVTIEREPELRSGQPEKLFDLGPTVREAWDIMPDGERFVVIRGLPPRPPATTLHIVRNWVEELRRSVPSGQ